MIEVFRTNITEAVAAERVRKLLELALPGARVSFDLEDCDRILRIEYRSCPAAATLELLQDQGYACSLLDT